MFPKKAMFPAFVFGCIFCFSVSSVSAGAWLLAEDGVSRSVVIVSADATAVEKHAAEELCHFLGKVTGARIRKSADPVRGKYSIWLGTPATNPQIRRARLERRVDALSDQGFLLNAARDGLVIAGRTDIGVLYGAYAFLEEHVGMRWFFPGEEGEYCPEIPDLKISAMDEVQNPDFQIRRVGFDSARTSGKMIDSWEWLARNRMQTRKHLPNPYDGRGAAYPEEYDKRGHPVIGGIEGAWRRLFSASLFDEHPEYFAKYDGDRRAPGREGIERYRWQPCTTNPGVIKIASDFMLDFFEKNPGKTITIANVDWPKFCECDACTALDPPEEIARGYGGRLSTRWFTFVNEISRPVWEAKPDANITALAYQDFRLPPLEVVPDPRLTIMLCPHDRCMRHALDDRNCAANSFFREMFEGWAEFENPRANYTYYGAGWMRSPVINVRPADRVAAADMRYMHGLGQTYWYYRATPPDGCYRHLERRGRDVELYQKKWRANLHMHYIQAKLAWDINTDVEELTREINEKFYGPAGEAMHRFRELLLDLWDETPGHYMYNTGYALLARSLTAPNAVSDLLGLLDEAERAAAGRKKYMDRVAEDRAIFESTWLRAYREFQDRPMEDIRASRREGPVTIDGRLDEADWGRAQRVTGFVKIGGEPVEAETYVRLLYDDEYFYVGLEMEEPDTAGLVMDTSGRDDIRIFGDDTIELFIDPDAGRELGAGERYVHITVNPAGAVRDSVRFVGEPVSGDASFRTDVKAAARTGEGMWTVELRVSAESLEGEIKDGGIWKMDVGRARKPVPEVSTWWDGSFHEPAGFRNVAFDRVIIANGRFDDVVVIDSESALRSPWEYQDDPPLEPQGWRPNFHSPGKLSMVTEDAYAGEYSLRLEPLEGRRSCAVYTRMRDIELTEGMKLKVSFAARGEGTLVVSAYNFSRVPGERRVVHEATERIGEVELDSNWQRYEMEYTHSNAHPVGSLVFNARGASYIDDVFMVPAR